MPAEASSAGPRRPARPRAAGRSAGSGRSKYSVVEVEQPAELGHRVRVVVDPQVDEDVAAAAVPAVGRHDEHRGGLPTAPVAACPVTGQQRARAAGRASGSAGSLPSQADSIASTTSGPVEDVALDRVAVADPRRRPSRGSLGAGVRRRRAGGVDHAGLPLLRAARPRLSARRASPAAEPPVAQQARGRPGGRRGWRSAWVAIGADAGTRRQVRRLPRRGTSRPPRRRSGCRRRCARRSRTSRPPG